MFFLRKRKKSSKKPMKPSAEKKNAQKKETKSNVISLDRKRYAKREERAVKAVLTISTLFFIFSLGGSIFALATREIIPTVVVESGSVYVPNVQQGIIIRSETVYSSPASGKVVFEVDAHERVRGGSLVATVRNVENIAELEEESELLARTILNLQDQRSNISAFADDAIEVNNRTQVLTNSNIHRLVGTDMSAMHDLQEGVNAYVLLRNDMLMSENRGALEPYVMRNIQNVAMISQNIANVVATGSGIVSHVIDGMEGVITPQNMEFLTPEQTRMIINGENIGRPEYTIFNESIFKIVNSNEWFIASYIENELVIDWNQGANTTIYVERGDDFVPMEATIYRLVRGEYETYVVLRARSFMIEHIDQRSINFTIVNSHHRGLKIPEDAIATRTFLVVPTSHIYRVQNSQNNQVNNMVVKVEQDEYGNTIHNYVRITPMTVRSRGVSGEAMYILQNFNNLSLGDMIINQSSPDQPYVLSQVVTDMGVFRVNHGIASFTSIDTEGMVVGNDGYVVICPDRNSGLGAISVHDRIISDTQNHPIEEGQKIF